MNEASVYLLKQNNDTKEIFSNNFFLSTFQSYHPLRENAPYWHFRLYCMKTKKSSDKMLPLVGIEPSQPLIVSPTLSSLH